MAAKQDNHTKHGKKADEGKRRAKHGHGRRGDDVNVFIDSKRGRKTEVWIEPANEENADEANGE